MLENRDVKFSAMMHEKTLNFRGLGKKSLEIQEAISVKKGNGLEIKWKGQIKNIDAWIDSRNELEYRMIHECGGAFQEFYTKNNIFFIEGISADSKVAIVTMQRGFAESEKVWVL